MKNINKWVVYFPYDTDNTYDTDKEGFYTLQDIINYCKENNMPGFVTCDAFSLELLEQEQLEG